MRLKNILLVVEDVERSRRFYEELFGLHVITAFDGNMILTEGLVLQEREIWEKLTGKKVKNAGNNAELYFEENELTKFAGKLEKSDWNITYVNPLKEESGGQQVIRIYDPDGHLIEIGESLEHAEKRQKEGFAKMERNLVDIMMISQLQEKDDLIAYTDEMDRLCRMARKVCNARATAGISGRIYRQTGKCTGDA